MILGWCGAIIALLLLVYAPEPVVSKKKIVKLIVPHKIKYIHHTHVLLVRPSTKKKAAKVHEDASEEDGPYQHLHYHHDSGRRKAKPHIHYVLPYIAEAKQGLYKKHREGEEGDAYLVPVDAYNRKLPEEVRDQLSKPVVDPHTHYEEPLKKTRYFYETEHEPEPYSTKPYGLSYVAAKSYETFPSQLKKPKYDTEYLGTYSEVDPISLPPEVGGWRSSSYVGS